MLTKQQRQQHNEAMKKYFKTEKGKKAHLKWQQENPDKFKESQKKYWQSERGKAIKREANRRYREKMKQKNYPNGKVVV